jgi:localization factor PodJL
MRTDLPWNVAGIPPEAREAARAAARREGLSVGEWLTRRILHSFSEAGEAHAPARSDWSGTAQAPRHFEEPVMMMANLRNTQDMLARVSRSESETQNAYRRIEDQLRNLARRLDTTERSQSEHTRAMHDAAAEINLASHEQTEAFEQLGAHVIGLGERIERIEAQVATDESDEVVKGLHDGLSRVADQVAETANQSASQIASLATTLEAVVGKMNDAHEQSATATTLLSQRMSLIDERVRAMETTTLVKVDALDRAIRRIDSEKTSHNELIEKAVAGIEGTYTALRSEMKQGLQALDTRYAAKREELEAAIRQLESEQNSHRSEIQKAVDELETRFAAGLASNPEAEKQAQIIRQMEETIASLSARIAAHETNTTSTVARLEEGFTRLENLGSPLDSRIDGLERSIQDVAGRIDAAGQQVSSTAANVQDLASRIAGAEHQASSAANGIQDITARITATEQQATATAASVQSIAARIDTVEQHWTNAIGHVEQDLKDVGDRLDTQGRNNRDAVEELRASLHNTTARLEVIEGLPATTEPHADQPAAPAFAPASETPQAPTTFDPPPFAQEMSAQNADNQNTGTSFGDNDIHRAFGTRKDAFQAAPPVENEDVFELDHPMAAESLDTAIREDEGTPLHQDEEAAEHGESHLLSAHRSIPVTSGMDDDAPMRSTLGGFTWGARQDEPEPVEDTQPRSRTLIIGLIALVAILAIAAGVAFSQHFGRSSTTPVTATAPQKTVKPLATRPASPPATGKQAAQTPAAKAAAKPAHAQAATKAAETNAPAAATPETKKPEAKAATSETAKEPVKQTAATTPSEQAAGAQVPTGHASAKAQPDRLTALADGGNARAQLLMGLKYLDGNGVAVNETIAAKWLQGAANQGEPVAQYRLGTLYERGRGVGADLAKAAHWYQVAAKQGNRKAMHNLAVAYAEGRGVEKNFTEAARWFQRAAAFGLADSQFNLAVLYERGLGVPQSLSEAYKWYAIAAAQGDSESKARVQALVTQLKPQDRDSAEKAAASFKPETMNRAANIAPDMPSTSHG